MNRIKMPGRIAKLMCDSITCLELDLTDTSVLTEAASGAYVVTSLLAALSGCPQVIAVARDTTHGTAREVIEYSKWWASQLGVSSRIKFSDEPAHIFAPEVDLVTNLGHVRPIDNVFIEKMRPNSAIALMFEPWEFRPSDVDLPACRRCNIPVMGTDETDCRLDTFRYVGILALKLLLECQCEAYRSNVLVIGSSPFGSAVCEVLTNNGSAVTLLDPMAPTYRNELCQDTFKNLDAIVLVEHKFREPLFGDDSIPLEWIEATSTNLIHICGNIDTDQLRRIGICKVPANGVPPSWMTVGTDYVGPKPVIDLHAGGLRVGQELVAAMRQFSHADVAAQHVLSTSAPALPLVPGTARAGSS